MAAVGDSRKRIYQRLGHVADHGQAAAHVTVQSAIADGQLALVARCQHQRAPLVGQRHEGDAAQPGLQILLSDVARGAGEERIEHAQEFIVDSRDGGDLEADAQVLRQGARVGDAAFR